MGRCSPTLPDPYATVTAMLAALRGGAISAIELLDLHLARIAQYNPVLNAIVTPDYERARQAAAEADSARARGDHRPLLGLPITIKDCIDVRGLPTTGGGLVERADAIAEEDAPLVARLRAAGVVIMGKTNAPPYAKDWQSSNPLFGTSNNPWDLGRTPGGSTGGGAAAVAAGLTPYSFGGDYGGSIRIPAAFCGLYGHKPSEGTVPRRGHFPSPNGVKSTPGLAVQGPLARSARDLEIALDIVCGPDLDDAVGWRLAFPPPRHDRLADFRVAVMPPVPWLPVQPAIAAALDDLAGCLSRLGAHVEVTQPEAWGDLRDYYSLYVHFSAADTTVGRGREDVLREAGNQRHHGRSFVDRAWAAGLEGTAGDYIAWAYRRDRYRDAMRAFFRNWDVLLAPCNSVVAFPHTDAPWPERMFEIEGQTVPYGWQAFYPSLGNLSGHPGTAFPWGRTAEGLPIGLQALGPNLEDRTPIRFAELVGETFGGFVPPPGYR